MSNNLLIACTYTAGSPYEKEAHQLAASAARFGYAVRGIAVPEQGDWWRNVGMKPSYVLELLESHPGPLLFLDADCVILEPLEEMLSLLEVADLTVKYRPGNCLSALFNAAVLLAVRTPATLQVVKTWAERGRDYAHLHRFSEQGAFAEGMLYAQSELRFAPLPEKFHMFPIRGTGEAPPGCVILHNKTSNQVRSTALPTAPPAQVCRLAGDAHLVSIGPTDPMKPQGLPMSGHAATATDFAEYASRFGISKYWSIGVNSAHSDTHRLEQAKILAMRKLFAQFPVGARVVLADNDVVFLRNPQRIADAVANADVACAWHEVEGQEVPCCAALGLRLTEPMRDRLLIDLERTYARMEHQRLPGEVLPLALKEVLWRLANELPSAKLPSQAVTDITHVTSDTVAVALRGQLRCIPGELPCHTHFHPAPISQPMAMFN